jgi:uncharacterized membrane protein YkoI
VVSHHPHTNQEDDMRRSTKIMAGAALTVAVAGTAGVAAAAASDDDGPDTPITGDALQRAEAAALAATGGGRVTETEIDDEDSYYEVEVTLDDGRQVDVQLDRQFAVVSTETDDDERNDSD